PKDLKREIQALKRKLKALEAERAVYLRAAHAWAKQRHTQSEVESWFKGNLEEGGSLADLIDGIEKRGRSNGRALPRGLFKNGAGQVSQNLRARRNKRRRTSSAQRRTAD